MALNPQLANAGANASADAVAALLNGGFLDILDGTQPADANTSITTQVRGASLTFGNPAFSAAAAGVASANAITSDNSADATVTVTWFRIYKSDHVTVVADGSVGTAGCNLNFNTVSFQVGGTVAVTLFTYTQQMS